MHWLLHSSSFWTASNESTIQVFCILSSSCIVSLYRLTLHRIIKFTFKWFNVVTKSCCQFLVGSCFSISSICSNKSLAEIPNNLWPSSSNNVHHNGLPASSSIFALILYRIVSGFLTAAPSKSQYRPTNERCTICPLYLKANTLSKWLNLTWDTLNTLLLLFLIAATLSACCIVISTNICCVLMQSKPIHKKRKSKLV